MVNIHTLLKNLHETIFCLPKLRAFSVTSLLGKKLRLHMCIHNIISNLNVFLESLNNMKDSNWNYTLSPQYLVDCDHKNARCVGGWPTQALSFLRTISRNKAPQDEDYQYTGKNGTCRKFMSKVNLNINNIYEFKLNSNEDQLRLKLANYGPLVVTIFVNKKTGLFQNYKSGVFYEKDCPQSTEKFNQCEKVNHSVLLVGYGITKNNKKPYFLILNSWVSKTI